MNEWISGPLIEIKRLELFNDETHACLLGIEDFHLNSGSFMHLVGPSGSGKSLFLKCLIYLFPIKFETFKFKGQSINQLAINLYRRRVLYLNQFPDLGDLQVQDIYQKFSSLAIYRTPEAPWKMNLAQQFMEHLNYDWQDWKQKSSQHLSGGEWQMLQHSLGIAAGPDVYLLDETLAAIDKDKRKLILDFYVNQVKVEKKSVILVDHHTLAHPDIIEKNFLDFTTHTRNSGNLSGRKQNNQTA
jgi:ABC-type iron transport system FetAB ATPase subunit